MGSPSRQLHTHVVRHQGQLLLPLLRSPALPRVQVGNGWRVNAVQNELSVALGGSVPGKSLNADEFGAEGAALLGRYMSNQDRCAPL